MKSELFVSHGAQGRLRFLAGAAAMLLTLAGCGGYGDNNCY